MRGGMLSQMSIREFVLPVAVVFVVAMILLPLPTVLLDFLLASNFAFCVLLLLTTLFISEPDRFTSLPSLLLLSTLFRLGLNISSTRVILSGGDSPEVILSFGELVVGGSLIIGLVIFGIISIIQFIVIAKGSERVAEVAARFTLDALPGKQMSIDADMRAGVLSLAEAREKRRELHRESKLYGALDGAMKFIKGDAIVSICIIFVNILAGLLVGVSRDGLGLMEALETYTILTVGDGLASQIPAVLVSVAAGIVVTRVSAKSDGKLSEEIALQLVDEPIALIVSGMVLMVIAIIPGAPFFVFSFVGAFPLSIAYLRLRHRRAELEGPKDFPFRPRVMPILTLRLSPQAARQLQVENKILSYVEATRADIFEKMGVVVPELCFDINPFQERMIAEFLLHGIVVSQCSQDSNGECVADSSNDQWTCSVATIIKDTLWDMLPELIDDRHTRSLLDIHDSYCADIIESVLQERLKLTTLTLLLRTLVEENISIRDINKILQGVNEFLIDEKEKNFHDMSSLNFAARKNLSKSLLHESFGDSRQLRGVALTAEMESSIAAQVEAGLPPHPVMVSQINTLLDEYLESVSGKQTLFCAGSVRYVLARMLEPFRGRVQVIAYEEVTPSYGISVDYLNGKSRMIESKDSYAEAA